jgi:hypothetical protein
MDDQWKRIEELAAKLGGTATRIDDKWCKVITPGLTLPMNRYDRAERELQDEVTRIINRHIDNDDLHSM